ncbi:hypothetical protein HanXRQr2_Chr03g0135471 [Helianthus annuus]|uniref:Uncharacterized protein n=1 Tax=Helianthus annuus TaxID=4232 RepID=A0A9K3NXW5_HELAN|nr:hypothetical protein HanXRQr2_Chr03g0135471 [Helianthus annuus]
MKLVRAFSAWIQPGVHALPNNALLDFSESSSRPSSSIVQSSTDPVISPS